MDKAEKPRERLTIKEQLGHAGSAIDELTKEREEYRTRWLVAECGARELAATLRMVLENMGGHQHWDSFGTAGANCPICQRQMEAETQAREVLGALERPCTCHPDDNPPRPCPKKYAYSKCVKAASVGQPPRRDRS